jgi:hypothetical protein
MKTSEIFSRANAIAAKPLKELDSQKLNEVFADLKRRTPKSFLLSERAKGVLPNG